MPAGKQWWRAYADARHDPKLQRMPGLLFKRWFNLLCLCCSLDGSLPDLRDIAYDLRCSLKSAEALVAELARRGLLDKFGNTYKPHNWDGRQFKSDLSTERVKRFRQRSSNVTGNRTRAEQNRETGNGTSGKASDPVAVARGWDERSRLQLAERAEIEREHNGPQSRSGGRT